MCACLKWYLLLADAFLRQHLWTLFFKVCSKWSICFMVFFLLLLLRDLFYFGNKEKPACCFSDLFYRPIYFGWSFYIFICNFNRIPEVHKRANLRHCRSLYLNLEMISRNYGLLVNLKQLKWSMVTEIKNNQEMALLDVKVFLFIIWLC